jgi:hypothetical protein
VTGARTIALVALLAAGGLGGFAAWGADYYRVPFHERPIHARHCLLRSGEGAGLVLGIAAAGLFATNLLYLLRKRLISWERLGSLRAWMAFHVGTGLLGAVCVLLHSGFHLRSALGWLAAVPLVVVVATGLVGRYIYAHVPRSAEGRELDRGELRRRLLAEQERLRALGFEVAIPDEQEHWVPRSLPARILALVAGDREVAREYRALRDRLLADPRVGAEALRILPLLRRFAQDQHRLARHGELRSLMGAWRFLHRWLALLLLFALVFHVLIALRYAEIRGFH